MHLNKNYSACVHVDSSSVGDSWIVALGQYEGGELWTEDKSGDVLVLVAKRFKGHQPVSPGRCSKRDSLIFMRRGVASTA